MLDVEVSDSSLRDARSTIEDRVGSVRTQISTDGGRRTGSLGGEQLSRENAMSRQLLTAQLEKLDEIHEEIEQLGASGLGGGGRGGGGGGGGGFFQGLGLGSAAKKSGGVLGTLGSLLGGISAGGAATVGGGLLAGGAGAAGLEKIRQDSSWSPLQDFSRRGS
jgi:hypothetical protein